MRFATGLIGALVAGALAFGGGAASAAVVDYFLVIDGLKGPSTTHAGGIEISSFQWGVGRGISSPTGGAADREASAPSVSEIVVTKNTDSSSPGLMKASQAGQHFPRATLYCRKAGGEQVYLLTNVWVSHFQGGPAERLTISFGKIELEHPAGGITDAVRR